MGSLDGDAARLTRAADAILELRRELEAGEPWPLAELYGTEAEASWGPHELLAHLDEMLPYWLGQVERILEGDASAAVPFGRIADDPIRIGVIGRDREVPIRELLSRLESEGRRVAARMSQLGDDEIARWGLHPRVGEVTVGRLFERFMTSHLEEHLAQLREIVAARGT